MSATEELRALLDERCVEWCESTIKPNATWFPDSFGVNCRVAPWGELLQVKRFGLTPEQAIAATLGGGECENLIDPWGVHESFENDFECSACHASGHANGNIDHGEFLYCPRCGAKVRKEVEQ